MKSASTPTTAQSLGSLLKSARDIMRKYKGLNGDLDRLPMLTWIMFLKFLDDLELQREGEARLAGKKFKPAVEPPYRWRDWAAKSDGVTGDELLGFINIPTNILFFDRSGPTREVWYYEQPLPEGRKNYTKTAPIQFEEFAPLVAWWNNREENERAWKVPTAELLANGCNLDPKNPRAKEDITHLPPDQLAASILEKERRIAVIVGNIQGLLTKQGK
jgi:type I restriction-modification system DNA methylase subunit